MLQQNKQFEQAKMHMLQFRELYDLQDEAAKSSDPEVLEQAQVLGQLLGC